MSGQVARSSEAEQKLSAARKHAEDLISALNNEIADAERRFRIFAICIALASVASVVLIVAAVMV